MQKKKSEIAVLYNVQATCFGVFGLRFASNLYILDIFRHLPLFGSKWRNVTSIKRHFLKKLTDICDFFVSGRNVVLNDSRLLLQRAKPAKVSRGCHFVPPSEYRAASFNKIAALKYRERLERHDTERPAKVSRVNSYHVTPLACC